MRHIRTHLRVPGPQQLRRALQYTVYYTTCSPLRQEEKSGIPLTHRQLYAAGQDKKRNRFRRVCGRKIGFSREGTTAIYAYAAYARVTFPERRQREQTATVFGVPSTIAFTLRMLGFHVRLVFRLEWDTFCPYTTPFPQILHFAILDTSLLWFRACQVMTRLQT